MRNAPIARLLAAVLAAMLSPLATSASTEEREAFTIQTDIGAVWQAKNNVQIPNDANGTRFSLQDTVGSGPWPAIRIEGNWAINEKHGLRLLWAPLSYSETGLLESDTRFAGETYDAGQPVRAEYRFNSWRAGYRYHALARDKWDFWVGATLKIRDARIRLTQEGTRSQDDDVGVVPLLYLAGEYRFGDRWSVAADLDGLAGGPGRAIDFGIRLNYRLAEQWQIGLGYRTLEGGADTDDVYNFSWFNSMLVSAAYRF